VDGGAFVGDRPGDAQPERGRDDDAREETASPGLGGGDDHEFEGSVRVQSLGAATLGVERPTPPVWAASRVSGGGPNS
jgi:hypothetical protein